MSSKPASVAAGAGVTALTAASALRGVARRISRRRRSDIDGLLAPPEEFRRHIVMASDEGRLHVVEAGQPDGPTIVLCHGVLLRWWVWNAVFELLGDRFRILAWDMRGHGRSRPGNEAISIHRIGLDLLEVLEELDVSDAVVVGHSMGGMAVLDAAITDHERLSARVRHLVLLATSADALRTAALASSARSLLGGLSRAVGGRDAPLPLGGADVSTVAVRMAFGTSPSARAVAQVREMVSTTSPRTAIGASRAITEHNVVDQLHLVRIPNTVVVGSHDRITPPGPARRLARGLRRSRTQIIEVPDAGHQLMQEAPQELCQIIATAATDSEASVAG